MFSIIKKMKSQHIEEINLFFSSDRTIVCRKNKSILIRGLNGGENIYKLWNFEQVYIFDN